MLNYDDSLPNLVCEVQAESWKFREPYLGSQIAEGLACWKSITHHYNIILTSILYQVQTLMSHNTEESENSPESPHLGETKRMRSVYQPFFAGGEAICPHYHTMLRLCSWNSSDHRPVLSASIQIIIPCLDQNFRKFQEDQFSSWSKIKQWIWIIVFHKIQRPIDFLFIGSRYSKPWFQEIVAFLL